MSLGRHLLGRIGQGLADEEALELRDEDLAVVEVVEVVEAFDANRELGDFAVEEELLGGAMVHGTPFGPNEWVYKGATKFTMSYIVGGRRLRSGDDGSMIGQIELTANEQDLVNQILFGHARNLEYEETIANGERSATLVQSLLDREAIPEVRMRYFTDPEYHISNPKASLYELFLRNTRTAAEMYRHPHFLPYLHYFVFGADLPQGVKETFLARYLESDGDREQLADLARSQLRELMRTRPPQDYKLPESFYQLALDCGCEQWDARAVRNALKVAGRSLSRSGR
jgi:hypothetical protein